MPTCQQCRKTWTWKETLLAVVKLKKYDICPYCRSKQYPSRSTKNNLALLPSIVAVLWLPFMAFGIPLSIIFIIELVMVIACISILPYFYHITDDDEPMW